MQTPEPTAAQDRGCLSEQAPDTVSGGGTPERDGGRSVTTASPRSFEPAPPPPPDSKTPKRPRSSAARDLDYSAVAVIGSRGYRGDIGYALDYELRGATAVISGGARGVDRVAESFGEKLGIRVVSYRPCETEGSFVVHKWIDGRDTGAVCHDGEPLRYPVFGLAAKARNWWIVRDAGRVAALWDGTSSGTAHGIAAATRFSRPVRIWMDGDS